MGTGQSGHGKGWVPGKPGKHKLGHPAPCHRRNREGQGQYQEGLGRMVAECLTWAEQGTDKADFLLGAPCTIVTWGHAQA